MTLGLVAVPGSGVCALVAAQRIVACTAQWLTDQGLRSGDATAATDQLTRSGRVPVGIVFNGAVAEVIGLLEQPTPAVREALSLLRGRGIGIAMMTGDRAEAAHAIAAELGIADIHAKARPDDKARLVAQAQHCARDGLIKSRSGAPPYDYGWPWLRWRGHSNDRATL
jgi:Cu+-exporting ATPase